MEIKGIDVSSWQGVIDWETVDKSGQRFAIVRATVGREYVDPYFYRNMEESQKYGIPTGAYHYCLASSEDESVAEAKHFINVIGKSHIEYPAVLDMEYRGLTGLSRPLLNNITVSFLNEVENAGYYPMLYADRYWLENLLDSDDLKRFDKWLGEYGTDSYTYTGNVGIWQYTDTCKVSGINGYADCDISYRDYKAIIKDGGWNNLDKGLTLQEAKRVIQDKCGFDDNTMLFLSMYKYSDSLILRLAEQMVKC